MSALECDPVWPVDELAIPLDVFGYLWVFRKIISCQET